MIRVLTRSACIAGFVSVLGIPLAGLQDRPPSAPPKSAGKIDLNIALEKDLLTLPGVDAAVAKQIMAGRPYSTIAELSRAGLPKATIDKIAPLVMVSPATAPPSLEAIRRGSPSAPPGAHPPGAGGPGARGGPTAPPGVKVNVNTASEKELTTLPGIDLSLAKKIIAARPYDSLKDLSKAGVTAATIAKITPLSIAGPSAPPGALRATETVDPSYRKGPPVPGQVWANKETKIYYAPGDMRIGTPAQGNWIPETEAIKQGYRPAGSSPK
jgi:DNA uptake protein ComE-like DNA-binding protein